MKYHLICLITISILFLAPQLNDMCIYDETIWFHGPAKSIVETGKPIMYCGEDVIRYFNDHPPLYNYLVSIFPLFFGFSNISLRFFNFFNALFIIITVFFFCDHFFQNRNKSFIASLLIMINPYVCNTLMLLDPDTSTLALCSLLTQLFILKKKFISAQISFTFLTFMKITQPILIAPSLLFLYYLHTRDIRKTCKKISLIYFRGGMIHIIVMYIYAIITGMHPLAHFYYLFRTGTNNFKQISIISTMISELNRFFTLSNPYTYIIIIAACTYLCFRKTDQNNYFAIIGLLFTSVPFFVLYTTRFVYYPKYYMSSFLIMLIVSFYILLSHINFTEKKLIYIAIFMICSLFFSYFKDIIYTCPLMNMNLKYIDQIHCLPPFTYFIPLLLWLFIYKKKYAVHMLLIIYASACITTDCFMFSADYRTKYFYGHTGYEQLQEFFKKAHDYEILCKTDVGILSNKKFYNIDFVKLSSENLKIIKYVCKNTYFNLNRAFLPETQKLLKEEGFTHIHTFGHFIVYEKVSQ